jgi:hypothetical protein
MPFVDAASADRRPINLFAAQLNSRCLGAADVRLVILGFARKGNGASAADLKFLHHLQQTRLGTSNRKAALES